MIYKTAVAATEAVNRGFVEQKTSGLLANLTTTAGGAGGDQATSCRLRVHRGGGAAAVQRGSVAAAGAPPGTKMRHSADSADSANTIQRSARGGDAALFQVALGTRQQVESSIWLAIETCYFATETSNATSSATSSSSSAVTSSVTSAAEKRTSLIADNRVWRRIETRTQRLLSGRPVVIAVVGSRRGLEP